MDVYAAVLEDIIALARGATALPVFKGPMPADNAVAIDLSAGGSDAVMLSRATIESVDIVINGKHRDMPAIRDALGAIHRALTRASAYPNNDRYQLYAVTTARAPCYAGREPGDQWLFVSAVTVRFYDKQGG